MLELLSARSGATTARLAGKLLHSMHDPQREALRSIGDLARRDPPCVVVVGFGLGYQVEALLQETDESAILIFEPLEELVSEARAARDLDAMFGSQRVVLTQTAAQLNEALTDHGVSGFEVVRLESRCAVDEKEFDAARQVIDAYRSRLDINRNTVNRFAKLWVRNLCRNITTVAQAEPVSRLDGVHKGVPGLLLAAGPTLDQVIGKLPSLARRTVVVAVDTAVGTAIRAGVTPDYAVVVDPQYWNSRHLDRVSASETTLVSESSAYPTIFGHFDVPHYLCSSVFPLGRRLERVLGSFGSLGAGGSVSTTAWDLLRRMGCDPIFVAGLDLGFPNGRTHCRDSFFEELAIAIGTRYRTAERVIHRYIWSADPRQTPSNDGGVVLTDRRMEVYRLWFESQLSVTTNQDTRSITNGGVDIRGLETCPLDKVALLPDRRAEIDNSRKSLRHVPQSAPDRLQAVVSEIAALAEHLISLESLASDALAILARIENEFHAGKQVEFSELEEIDTKIAAHPARAEASFLMQSAISSIRGGHGSQSMEAQLDASHQLYESLLHSATYHSEQFRHLVADGPGSS